MADDEENENIKITGNESMKQSSSLQQMLDSITKERSKPSFSISGGIRRTFIHLTKIRGARKNSSLF
jgi:hypothetical protein